MAQACLVGTAQIASSSFQAAVAGSDQQSVVRRGFLSGNPQSFTKPGAHKNVFQKSQLLGSGAPFREAAATAPRAAVTAPTPPKSDIKKESDVRTLQITEDTTLLRGRCTERLKFEVEYALKKGTSENVYLIKGEAATAIINLPDQAFADAMTAALSQACSLHRVDHLVVGHVSPKRVEALVQLVKARAASVTPLKVHCSNPAAKLLEASLPEEVVGGVELVTVRQGDTLDLGSGHVLQFLPTPTPRWPDGMVTYDRGTQILYTHKFFSSHVSCQNTFDLGGWDAYGEDWRYFYDCMLGPSPRPSLAALDKMPIAAQFSAPSYKGRTGFDVVKADIGFLLSSMLRTLRLPIDTAAAAAGKLASTTAAPEETFVVSALAPLHGPIVRGSLTELVRSYRSWTEEKVKQADEATVAVLFASAYGNTSALAQAISRGIMRAGVGVETINCEFASAEEIGEAVRRSSGFCVGSPTLAGHMPTPVQEALGVILRDEGARNKPCGVFGSFGWSGEAVDEMEQRLKNGGFSFAFPPVRCKFKPTESMLQTCEESGTDIAQAVIKAKAKQKAASAPKFVTASSVEQAVGRVVGSLCVLTAKRGDAESGMLASWVSQASFNPPGVTVAVAKERAVESLVLPGDSFVLNVLGEATGTPIIKQMLKPFAPGEARFGALETQEAPCGARILKDAISWVECTVKDRMEVGDHWIVYATVTDGKLQNDKELTALHHRKSGTRY